MTRTRAKKKAAKKPSRRKASSRPAAKKRAGRPKASAPASKSSTSSIGSKRVSTGKLQFASRKRRRSQWSEFIQECLDLGFGQTQLVEVPTGRDPKAFRVRVSAVVSKEVRPHRDDAKFRCRLTADEKHIGVTCDRA